jgi:general secretion pathway protein A
MYERFFGLGERPFDTSPNPQYLILTSSHREALGNLEYGITAGKGITLLLGEAGTGKTTLLRSVLAARTNERQPGCVYLNNPTLKREEFLELVAHGLGLSDAARNSKARFLLEMEQLLRRRNAAGLATVLAVDEAQSLPHELFEEIRLLANMETDTAKLLAVILAGQPELAHRLDEPGLRQLKQRVTLRCALVPLDLRETAAYIAARIRVAGAEPQALFSREAIISIYEGSSGIPRTISVICDNALLCAFALGERPVSADTVREVREDFGLRTVPVPVPAAAAAAESRHSPAGAWRNVRLFQSFRRTAATAREEELAATG